MSKEIARYEKRLEEINPEHKAVKTKKMLNGEKRNAQHDEFTRGIVEKLEKRHEIE